MASPKFNRERALRILVDAVTLGDRTACEIHKISGKSLCRYRNRLGNDPELARAVREKSRQDDLEWGAQRKAFLSEGIRKMRELIGQATIADLHAVTGAVKIVGELQVTVDTLNVGARADRESPPDAGAPGEDGVDDGAYTVAN